MMVNFLGHEKNFRPTNQGPHWSVITGSANTRFRPAHCVGSNGSDFKTVLNSGLRLVGSLSLERSLRINLESAPRAAGGR